MIFEKYAITIIITLLAIIVWLIYALIEYHKCCKLLQDTVEIQKSQLEMLRKNKIVGHFNNSEVTLGYAITENAAKFVNGAVEKFQRSGNERKDSDS